MHFRTVARPLTLPHRRFRLQVNDEEIPLPRALDDWDYQMDLVLRRTVHVDPQRARAESGLPPDAVLALSVVWTATGSNLRSPADHIRLEGPDARACEVGARLRGTDLGGNLVLDTALVLARAPRRANRRRPDAPARCFGAIVIPCVSKGMPRSSRWLSSTSPTPLSRTAPPGICRSGMTFSAPPWVRCCCS